MTFEEAYDKVHDMFPDVARPKGDANYPRLLAFMWSMMAVSMEKAGIKNVLDDIAYLGLDISIVNSKPFSSSTDDDTTEKPAKKSKKQGGNPEVTADDNSESS